jgi:hypothetical protein
LRIGNKNSIWLEMDDGMLVILAGFTLLAIIVVFG